MKDGTTWTEFYDYLYYGDETMLKYQDNRYFIQGWFEHQKYYLQVQNWKAPEEEWNLFETSNTTQQECVDKLLDAKVFEGKTIKDIFEDSILVDAGEDW
jgi:hypothetical protein